MNSSPPGPSCLRPLTLCLVCQIIYLIEREEEFDMRHCRRQLCFCRRWPFLGVRLVSPERLSHQHSRPLSPERMLLPSHHHAPSSCSPMVIELYDSPSTLVALILICTPRTTASCTAWNLLLAQMNVSYPTHIPSSIRLFKEYLWNAYCSQVSFRHPSLKKRERCKEFWDIPGWVKAVKGIPVPSPS